MPAVPVAQDEVSPGRSPRGLPALAPTALHDAAEADVAGGADPVHHEHQVVDLQRLS